MNASSDPVRKWTVSRWVRVLLIFSVCACWTLLYANMIRRTLGPGDDNLYLQSIALSAKSPSRLAELNQELIDSLDKLGYGDYVLYRVVLRSKYTNNYWAASNLQSLASWILPVDPALGMRAYHEVVATRAVLGSIATGLICLAALAAGLFLIRDPRLFAAAIIGVAGTAALFSSTTQALFQTLLPHIPDRVADNMSWIDAFGRSAYFFIDPGLEFGMFGTTPRSNFVVLSFVAAVHAMGRPALVSYLILAVAILFHASAGMSDAHPLCCLQSGIQAVGSHSSDADGFDCHLRRSGRLAGKPGKIAGLQFNHRGRFTSPAPVAFVRPVQVDEDV